MRMIHALHMFELHIRQLMFLLYRFGECVSKTPDYEVMPVWQFVCKFSKTNNYVFVNWLNILLIATQIRVPSLVTHWYGVPWCFCIVWYLALVSFFVQSVTHVHYMWLIESFEGFFRISQTVFVDLVAKSACLTSTTEFKLHVSTHRRGCNLD